MVTLTNVNPESRYNDAMPSSSDLNSLVPQPEPESRREFLVHTLAVGFALAVQPIGAQTITTDTNGLLAGEVKIPVKNGASSSTIPAYRACPVKGRGFPIVLVVQEIFGVHEHIKDVCRRLAKSGFCAVAPELFARQGDVSKMSDVQEIVTKVVSKVPDSQVMSDLDATANWAAKTSHGDIGRIADHWLLLGRPDRVALCGPQSQAESRRRVVRASGGRQQRHDAQESPGSWPARSSAPIIGFYGGKDAGIPLESIEKMRASLKVIGNPSEIYVYPEAQHGFNADYRPTYDKEAAQDAWKKMLAWFKKYDV